MLLEISREIKRKYVALEKTFVSSQKQRHFQYHKKKFHFETLLDHQIRLNRLFLINTSLWMRKCGLLQESCVIEGDAYKLLRGLGEALSTGCLAFVQENNSATA